MPSSPLADNARFGIAKSEEELGDILLLRGNEVGARESYENAIREYEAVAQIPSASEAPASLWTRATLHDRNLLVRDFAAAVKEYEEYAKNPVLPHAAEAAARASYLRNNTSDETRGRRRPAFSFSAPPVAGRHRLGHAPCAQCSGRAVFA